VNRIPYALSLGFRLLRVLPPTTPGKARLGRVLLGACRRTDDVAVTDRRGGQFLVPNLREPVALHLLIDGVYEPPLGDFLRAQLASGATFVDVGANVGVFTILAGWLVGPDGRVLALEPSPRVFPYLEHNVRRNGLENVRLRQCAALDHDGTSVSFYEAPAQHFGMGALAPQFDGQPTPVPGRTLDSLLEDEEIERVDLLKVDVEGFEADVFRGARRLLTSGRPPVIVFEFRDWAEERVPGGRPGDAQRLLMDWGFRVVRLADLEDGSSLSEPLTRGFETLVAMRE
jgi:FkbM family methyltransferase